MLNLISFKLNKKLALALGVWLCVSVAPSCGAAPVLDAPPAEPKDSRDALHEASGTKKAEPARDSKLRRMLPPFPISGKISRTIQKYTGLNLLGEYIASRIARSVLTKRLGGKVKVSIKTFSLTDLLAGKVKSVKCKLAGACIKGIRLGQITATTSQPVWLDLSNKRRVHLRSPVLVSIKAALSQKEVTEALNSPRVANSFSRLNLDLPGLGSQQLHVIRPRVEFQKDVVKIEATVVTEGAPETSGVPMVISGRLKLEGEDHIVLEDMKVTADDIIEPEKFAHFVEDLLNPLVDLRKLDRDDHAIRLSNILIDGDGISTEGKLLLAPKPQAALAQKRTVVK